VDLPAVEREHDEVLAQRSDELLRSQAQPGLLPHLADGRLAHVLALLHAAPEGVPVRVVRVARVAAVDHQDVVALVEQHDAHGPPVDDLDVHVGVGVVGVVGVVGGSGHGPGP